MFKYKRNDFSLKNSPKSPYLATKGLEAMRRMQEQAERNGLSDMTLEEINAEITATRRESAIKALQALDEMNKIAKLNGTSKMTLEEINAEIAATRRDMEARRNK